MRKTPSALAMNATDLIRAAHRLGVELAALEAVVEVESAGAGFLDDGRPVILFEGHKFWQRLVKRGVDPHEYATVHETILSPRWSREHYIGGAGEYDRLAEAEEVSLDACGSIDPAQEACSWGMFQILGSNHRACGFASVGAFVQAMYEHERRHLDAFCAFVRAEGILPSLQALDFETFALRYNGPAAAQHDYAGRIRRAYNKRSK